MTAARSTGRQRGRIEERGDSLRVIYYAGLDPVTRKRRYLRETIPGNDKAAWKKAEDKLAQFRDHVAKQRSAESTVPLSHAVDEWLRNNEVAESTYSGYENYIRRYIKPVLGKTPVNKIDARILENFYTELRRCRIRCDGKPFIEKHKQNGKHDCKTEECKPHKCSPLGRSTVRQIHSIISGTLSAAQRWNWIDVNPAPVTRRPKAKPPEPDPPTAAEAARLVDEAFRMEEKLKEDGGDWGTLVWLTMTTGIRRGELCSLRFSSIDFDEELLKVHRNWVNGKEKDTKTHQIRRIALDTETLALLREHKERVQKHVEKLDLKFTEDMFLFTSLDTRRGRVPDHQAPYSPSAVTQRYSDMATRLGIKTHIHALRHYSATELLTAGIDLRTVAGRLGHGGGGATTLRVYAARVAAADRKAAEILGSRMPKRAAGRKPGSRPPSQETI